MVKREQAAFMAVSLPVCVIPQTVVDAWICCAYHSLQDSGHAACCRPQLPNHNNNEITFTSAAAPRADGCSCRRFRSVPRRHGYV